MNIEIKGLFHISFGNWFRIYRFHRQVSGTIFRLNFSNVADDCSLLETARTFG